LFRKPLSASKKPGLSINIPLSYGKSTSEPIFWPKISTYPLFGRINPHNIRKKTLLPEPFAPLIPKSKPGSMSKSIPFSTIRLQKYLVIPRGKQRDIQRFRRGCDRHAPCELNWKNKRSKGGYNASYRCQFARRHTFAPDKLR